MEAVKPHWGWFLLAPVLLIGGIVAAFALVVSGVSGMASERQVVPVPGKGEVSFEEAGAVLVSFEETGAAPARVPSGLEVRIYSTGDSEALPMSSPGANYTYHYSGVAGRGIGAVEIPSPGSYRVETRLRQGTEPPPGAAVAIGRNPAGAILGAVFGAFALAGGGAVLALILVVVVAVKRSSFRRARQASLYAGHPPGQSY